MPAVGIDFGTTNSVIAQYSTQGTQVVPIDNAPVKWAPYGFDNVFPSVMASDAHSRLCFGWEAKQQASGRFDAVKRMFATQLDVAVDDRGTGLAVEEVATMLFAELKRRSADKATDFDQAVITVPANSKGRARHRTKLCAGMAGIEVLALINEPTAAAMAYAQRHPQARQLLVFDWGGGTLDVTVLQSIDGVFMERASSGLARSGGIDFDARLEKLVRESVPGLESMNSEERNLLRLEIELAKIRLSSADATSIEIPGGRSPVRITRSRFEDEVKGLIEESRIPLERCLRDLGIGPGSIDALVMVGGTCRIPAVRNFVQSILRADADPDINPMTAIGEGAAIAAAIMTGELKTSDFFVALEHSLGTFTFDPSAESLQFATLIQKGHVLPARATETFYPVFPEQDSVLVRVVEGDPDNALPDFTVLKEWSVPLPEPSSTNPRRGFELTYEYDIDGILQVTAKEEVSGKIILEDDVSYGVATDKRQLKQMSDRAKSAVDTGTIGAAAHVQLDDPEAQRLVNQAKVKVIPFLDITEATPIQQLVDALESGNGDVADIKDRLRRALAPHSYLF